MNERGKSDGSVVPEKSPNKGSGAPPSAEEMEGRDPAKGNPSQPIRHRTQSRTAPATEADAGTAGSTPVRQYLRQEPSAGNPPAGICTGGASQEASLP